jgi:hypothetical protein
MSTQGVTVQIVMTTFGANNGLVRPVSQTLASAGDRGKTTQTESND